MPLRRFQLRVQFPWVLVALTVLVLVAALAPLEPIRDAVGGGTANDARLERSFGYVALGPISSVLDAMTLFTVGQIIGFTLWAMGVYVVVRFIRRRTHRASVIREAVYAVSAFVILLIVYGAAVVLPRPMARLVVTRVDVIAVDFHAHTHHSHDGRPGWTVADVRDWHAASGYNAAYISDHASFDAVPEEVAIDSTVAGQGTLVLPALEAFYHGEHVNILNAGYRYKGLTTADFRVVDDQALALTSAIPNLEPVLIETIPGDLTKMIPATGPGTSGVRAIEIVDGSPRGMSQTRRDHELIVHLADSLNLALVAGSDNHGWGRTAPGWTLLRIPGWRGYGPDDLTTEIEKILRLAGRAGTYVVERTTANARPIAVAFTMPAVVWTVMRTLSSTERLAWLLWMWGLWAIVRVLRWRSVP